MPTNKKTASASRSKAASSPKPKARPAVKPATTGAKKSGAAKPGAKKSAEKKPAAKVALQLASPPKKVAVKAASVAKSVAAPAKKAAAPAKKIAAPAPAPAKPAPAKLAPPATPIAAPPASNTSCYLLLLSSHEKRGRRFVRLKAPSVLAWFQRAWRLAREGRNPELDLGGEVYGLSKLFDAIARHKLAIPATEEALMPLLTKHIFFERDLEVEPHFVHVETDDDEVPIEYFFFDDAFLDTSEALDRLPSPSRRAPPLEDEPEEESFEEEDDDNDPYTVLIEKLADA